MLPPRTSYSFRLLASLALATFLVMPTLVMPTVAVADEPTPSAPASGGEDGATDALAALEAAEELLTGPPSTTALAPTAPADVDPTLALLEVRKGLDELTPAQQDRARRLLARPSAPGPNDPIKYPSGEDRAHCTDHFCVHWVESGIHRPSLADDDLDGVPDFVASVAAEAEVVWNHEIDRLGFRAPLGDGTRGNVAGESRADLVDIYLGDTGARGVYGYAETEGNSTRMAGFLVIDNDFADFATPPLPSMRVTLAHEFLHLSQFGTDVTEDTWLMEATATWVEERVHDDVNDNRLYFQASSLRHQALPLDHPDGWYGNWIFFEHLTKSYGAGIVQRIWHEARSARVFSLDAIHKALAARGSSLADDLSRFAGSNTVPASFYPEGSAYPSARTAYARTLTWSRATTGSLAVRVPQLAAASFSLAPHSSLGRAWRVRVTIDAPAYESRAYLMLHKPGGVIQRRPIRLDSRGNASFSLPFHRGSVTKVGISLSNTSRRFTCDRGTARVCEGTPRDDRRLFRLRATAAS